MRSQTQARKKLPIGIQTFAKLREKDCYYVDKTPFALQLIDQGSTYFLSRPRRFGKSLFLDTLKELFEGNQALFEGLYAEQHWNWSVKYPVICLSFGSGVLKSLSALDAVIHEQLSAHEETYDLLPTMPDIPSRFKRLIRNLHQKTGQRVVVLVDEYDKPILDNLSSRQPLPEGLTEALGVGDRSVPQIAREMRDGLRNLYSVLKDSDAHLKFVFITGVSKFSKVSLFSGLNNLNDISIDAEYSAICGYTDTDVDTVFAPELPGLDRQQIRDWYNGYNWRGEAVYNPFDMLLLFQKREFRPYWFETGTPTFLVDFLVQHEWFTPDMMNLTVKHSLLSQFDVEQIAPEALLWQTGYLTLHQVEELSPGQWFYTLGYPNLEVETALNEALLPAYGPSARSLAAIHSHLFVALQKSDMVALHSSIQALFASIPHDWYRKNPLAQFEGHYASVFYSQLAALGLDVRGEDVTNRGQIDLSLRLGKQVYLFEFKVVNEADGSALQQLIERDYAAKYRTPGMGITLIGVEFSRVQRNVVGWDVVRLDLVP